MPASMTMMIGISASVNHGAARSDIAAHGNQFLKIFGKLFKKGVCNF